MTNKFTMLAAACCLSTASGAYAVQIADIDGTKVSLGGYVKAEGVFNRPDGNAAAGSENSFLAGMRQSRLNLKIAKDVDGHKVSGFFEGDFYGNSKADAGTAIYWRMRHAAIQVDNVMVGQFWNGQMLATAPLDPGMINFWGAGVGTIGGNGATVRPQLLMHYKTDGLRLSVQDPVYTDAGYPDLVASYLIKTESGVAVSLAATGRDTDTTPDVDDSESKFGAGFSVSGKVPVGKSSLHLSGYSGKGMGAYSGVGVGGAYRGADRIDAEDGDLVSQTGFVAGVKHSFSDNLKGTVRYAKITVDDEAETELVMNNVNLVYTYLKGLDIGMEWRRQTLGTVSQADSDWQRTRPKGQQLEFMAMFKF